MRPRLRRDLPDDERELLAERIAGALDIPVTVAGILFVLVVVAAGITPSDSDLSRVWDATGWVLWALFVAEFVLRLVIAPSTGRFLRRNWWQVVFLALPFLRFLRALTRTARLARVLTSSVRGTRTIAQVTASRLAWVASLTSIVILSASQVLYEFGPPSTFADTLHDVALATISGEPLGREGALAGVLDVVLAIYAVIVFAALAGTLGALFLEGRASHERPEATASDPVPDRPFNRPVRGRTMPG